MFSPFSARVNRTRMRQIERIDAELFGFYSLAGSALAYGVRRALILLANSALAISHWLLTIIGQVKTVLLLTNSG